MFYILDDLKINVLYSGDSGSIIWAVEHGETVDTLKYSFDEGLCWQNVTFVDTPITITGK